VVIKECNINTLSVLQLGEQAWVAIIGEKENGFFVSL